MMNPSIAWLHVVNVTSWSQAQIIPGMCMRIPFDQQSLDRERYEFLHVDLDEAVFTSKLVCVWYKIN